MSEDKKRDSLLLKVKKLLQASQTQTFIKKTLGLSRHKLDKLMEQLALSNIKCRKRISRLAPYHNLIKKWVTKGHDAKMIQGKLAAMQELVHYTTVRNFIKSLKKADPSQLPIRLPGEIAYLSVLPIKQSKDAYLFCLLLGQSHFSFFAVLPKPELFYLFQCMVNCFKHLKGVPRTVQFCEVSCLRLSETDVKEYEKFLIFYGSRKVNGIMPLAERQFCIYQCERAKNNILNSFFHCDVNRLASALKNKHTNLFNLEIHAHTKKQIAKEFELTEQPKLLPLPEKKFLFAQTTNKKVNKKGIVFYQRRSYKMPAGYAGKMIQVTPKNGQLVFSIHGKQIAILKYKPIKK